MNFPNKTLLRLQNDERAQAMVEFVIFLIIAMAVCVGMVASMRLLTFQFWAQQEARYLAFEEVWYAKEFYDDLLTEPVFNLANGPRFGRPQIVSERETEREVLENSGLSDLLAYNHLTIPGSTDSSSSGQGGDNKVSAPETMLARIEPSIWTKKARDWIEQMAKSESTLFVSTAFASYDLSGNVSDFVFNPLDDFNIDQSEDELGIESPHYRERLAPRIIRILKRQEFGETLCPLMQNIFSKYNRVPPRQIAGAGCANSFNRGFGIHLANSIDVQDIFREYENQMERGFSPNEALEVTIRREVVNQFYSFFDNTVRAAQNSTVNTTNTEQLEFEAAFVDSSITRMLTEMRYVGSNAAIGAILGAVASIAAADSSSRDVQAAQEAENDLVALLHTDATDILPILNPFYLSPAYLPVPSTFGNAAALLQDDLMRAVLSKEGEKVGPLIDESIKEITVGYKADGGLFPAARRHITGIEDVVLTSRFYLITQPWQITRRSSSLGGYREKGDQFDDLSDDTEEGMLRRRVFGLWLFPPVDAVFDMFSTIPGLDSLAPFAEAARSAQDIFDEVKTFLTDENPIFQIFNALSSLPLLGDFVPTMPKWPAVRPDAYPGSNELKGSTMDRPDKLMGEERTFQKYVDEQGDFNPPPKPVYHD